MADNNPTSEPQKTTCSSMFDINLPKSAFETTFRKRPHGLRTYVIILASIFVLEIILQNGTHSTSFLFYRKGEKYATNFFFSFLTNNMRICL